MVTVPKTEKTMIGCICSTCPTYNECMQNGKLGVFCAVGDEIRCFKNAQGCKCQECTVSSDYDFETAYHCRDGAPEMQSR
jgi:hypothetical protein